VLKENGYSVEILNWHNVNQSPEIIQKTLLKEKPDVIGFSVLHANRWGAIDIAAAAKSVDADIKIVFGGIGATFLWRHLLTHFRAIDYIVLGEGEFTFLKLIRTLEQQNEGRIDAIPGIAYRQGAQVFCTAPAETLQDLDQLPMPASYFKYQHVAFTRGCPGNCTFCGSPKFWGHRVRTHSPAYFVDQLERLVRQGINSFYFSDDTFAYKKQHVLTICRDIVDRGLNINWVAISRVNHVDEEMLQWMRKAGCTQISYGIESGSEKIRRLLNKRIRNEDVQKAFDSTKKYGILPRAYFIYGSPGESRETIQDTLNLMNSAKPLSAIFYILDLFPGTALYEAFKKTHRVTDDIWLHRIEDIMYFETDPSLSKDSVLKFGNILRQEFYRNLPGFIADVQPVADSSFDRLHADFFSRLGMTFTHGDYAAIDAIPNKEVLAEKLFLKSIRYFPNVRAYLGLGILYQKQRRFQKSRDILNQGLKRYADSMDLNICQGVTLMNLGAYSDALKRFLPYRSHPHVAPYIAKCYEQLGDVEDE
jgi:radical SAM superfamily enzyme YgiQ (UPF0313 family)